MTIKERNEMFDNFLDQSETPFIEEGRKVGVVYCIENKTNHMKYIGAAVNFRRRIFDYLRVYNNPMYHHARVIDVAMQEEGIDNFRIYPIRICSTIKSLYEWESHYIEEWGTTTPNGYNDVQGAVARVVKRVITSKADGIVTSIDNRRNRSKGVVAIHIQDKIMYICDSAKLFSVSVMNGCDKSIITHAAKTAKKFHGWYIIYLEPRSIVRTHERLQEMYKRNKGRRSGCLTGRDDEYKFYAELVLRQNWQHFIDEGYSIKGVLYDNNSSGYKIVTAM